MSVSDNKALVLRYYEVFNRHDLAASDACFHPSYRESAHRFHVACFAASPDIRYNLVEMIAEGDLVMDHWTSQGSFIGKVGNLDLTGQKLTWPGASTYRFAEGLIADMQLFGTLHEAVAQQVTDAAPDNHVFDEVQPGYKFRDRLLRPAKVRVARTGH